MKTNILANISCVILLWAASTGCSEETLPASGDDAGYISLDLDFDPSPLTGPRGDRSRASATTITKNDLTLTLSHSSGAIPPKTFTYEEFGAEQRVNTGRYTLEASYGNAGSEGWDMPYYYGSQQLTVKNEASTPVNLPVRLANAIVNITLSEEFISYMTDYTVTVTTATGTDYVWAKDEPRQLYVKPGSVMISVAFTKPNGKTATAQVDPFTAEARHRHNVTIDIEAGEAETLRLTFDDTISEVKDVDIDISDANLPMLASAPEILADGFEAGATISNISGSAYDSPLKATIVARGKISTAVLNVTSAYLTSKGWPESIDLANPGTHRSLLDSYGIKTQGLTDSKDVFAVVDFSGLISKLLYVDGADNTSSFSLTVTDKQGKEKTVNLFSVNIEKLIVEILEGSEVTAEGHAMIKIRYNGRSINDDVKLYAHNDRGTVDLLPFTAAPGSQDGTYDLTVNSSLVTLDSSLKVYATAGDEQSAEYEIRVPSLRLIDTETNAFAKHAYATVRLTNEEAIAAKGNVKFEVSTDGGSTYTEVASTVDSSRSRALAGGTVTYHLTGLTAATSYTFRAKLNDETSGTASFTTEEAAQLPDAGFDNWTAEQKGDYQYLWKVANTSAWATLNELTISTFGSGSGNGLSTGGCSYKATSGTIPANSRSTQSTATGGAIGTKKYSDGNTDGNANLHSDKQHRGSNAALIRTVGWGSGNSASASASGQHFGTCNTMTPGELYLGAYVGNTPVYGYTFSSRPSAVSFYYHYDVVSEGNGDYGSAEISVKDSDGNVIASATRQLNEQSTYTEERIELNYTDLTKKASGISIVFKSSINSAAMSENTKYWRCPGVKNVSGGEYVGSELYIDDIELIY